MRPHFSLVSHKRSILKQRATPAKVTAHPYFAAFTDGCVDAYSVSSATLASGFGLEETILAHT
jgi:hypothetical protein